LNHSYAECDVFVSIAKMKEHVTAGYTGAMKNCFGMAPVTIYGSAAGADEPARTPVGGRDPSLRRQAAFQERAAKRKTAARRGRKPTGCRALWWTWYRPDLSTWPSSKASSP